eukprot:TRINITY_DN19549_c0_g1_i1.p1 TRINITY_DN19549_c0_g1~~TRINITY_DN19549_c0_g1_i1.p1  ORF type:complete len:167 (-),score=34.35 TRINITY_DN19549_c0_g1_i1:259-759(-)
MASLLKAAASVAGMVFSGDLQNATTPCCNQPCQAPLVKYFSTDAPHGFCGEACMDPKKFSTYKKFEPNLTLATSQHPCSEQWTPDNKHQYSVYSSTVTHGVPGVLSVTLDLYLPAGIPDHSCCSAAVFGHCLGKTSVMIAGTGPFCCPSGATEETPCSTNEMAIVV